jgi:Ca-activated chloride channel family protein
LAPSRLGGEVAGLIELENGRDASALDEHRDRFAAGSINPVKQVAREPVSTFSIDVDTVSYAFARRSLNAGRLPPQAAVRAEEMINYFDYAYAPAESTAQPFKPTVTVVPSPWNAANKIVHIAIKGYELKGAERPRANLVLLVDVSGSMAPDDRLPLVKNGLRMLVDELKPDDTVAIVTYASGSGIALEPTKVSDKAKILSAIDMLQAGGSTAGASGIQDAYRLAAANFDKAGVNRVILATDGDFNVGITDQDALKGIIEREREKGIFLSILGVGAGNLNDSLMQTLAQNGNGVAAYADTLNEARKVLVEEASSTIFPIAKDVKIQVEWNPARVAEYRLVGYETRALKEADFNNDRVDAGDIGSGHTVTAIYEITPVGSNKKLVDDLRYAKPGNAPAGDAGNSNELGFLKMRFKQPNADVSEAVSLAITDAANRDALSDAPADVRFSIAVAGFAELLRGAPYQSGFGFDDVLEIAAAARGDDPFGQRSEFLNLVRLAKAARR